jgi:hypothetical protein
MCLECSCTALRAQVCVVGLEFTMRARSSSKSAWLMTSRANSFSKASTSTAQHVQLQEGTTYMFSGCASGLVVLSGAGRPIPPTVFYRRVGFVTMASHRRVHPNPASVLAIHVPLWCLGPM